MIGSAFGLVEDATKFQSGFLLASYDLEGIGLDDWRASMRERCVPDPPCRAPPSLMNEDGDATTCALSWQGVDWLRVTAN